MELLNEKIEAFSCKTAKMFQLSKCFSLCIFPAEVMGELRNSGNVSDNQMSSFGCLSHCPGSRGNGSGSAPPRIWAAALTNAASFWVRWHKTWLPPFQSGTCALFVHFFVRVESESAKLSAGNAASRRSRGGVCVCVTDGKDGKCPTQHGGCWQQPEPELWLLLQRCCSSRDAELQPPEVQLGEEKALGRHSSPL